MILLLRLQRTNEALVCLMKELEGVGSGIVATEVAKAPIVLDSAEEGEVVVEGVVGGTRSNHGSDSNRRDVVVVEIVIFIPCDDDEGSSGELVETRSHEGVQELSGECQTCIVTVIVDVRGIVRILRQGTIGKVIVQLLSIDNLGAAGGILANVIETNEGVVLTIVGSLVRSSIALIRKILHISLPAHTTSLEEINDGGLVPVVDTVAEHHEVISSNCYRLNQANNNVTNNFGSVTSHRKSRSRAVH
jgi:hypothetical protein